MNHAQTHFRTMTTYIPSLTLPAVLFENAASSILLPVAAGTAIGFSTRPKETQKTYLALRQPPLRPPPQVFGPMWTALYGLMGYAAYRAWNIGMSSFDAKKVVLTKVCCCQSCTQARKMTWSDACVDSKEQHSTPSNLR